MTTPPPPPAPAGAPAVAAPGSPARVTAVPARTTAEAVRPQVRPHVLPRVLPRVLPVGLPGQLLSFAAIGIASTLAYGLLFLVLRIGFAAQAANLIALLLTALGNTAANRRLTFGVSGRHGAARHQLQGLFVFALGLGLTGGSLAVLHAAAGSPPPVVELAVLVAANLAVTALRFLLMRVWIFRH